MSDIVFGDDEPDNLRDDEADDAVDEEADGE